MQIVLCEVNYPARIIQIEDDLRTMQRLVDGWIEIVNVCPSICLICNEEGLIREMPVNRTIHYKTDGGKEWCQVIHGPFFLCAHDGPECVTLSDEQARILKNLFDFNNPWLNSEIIRRLTK